jgi:hypothetical protein
MARPAADFALSGSFASSVLLAYEGPSEWLAIEVSLKAGELGTGSAYQLSLRSHQDRPVSIRAILRAEYPTGESTRPDHTFAAFELPVGDAQIARFGPLELPSELRGDVERYRLLLWIDADRELEFRIDCLLVSFA